MVLGYKYLHKGEQGCVLIALLQYAAFCARGGTPNQMSPCSCTGDPAVTGTLVSITTHLTDTVFVRHTHAGFRPLEVAWEKNNGETVGSEPLRWWVTDNGAHQSWARLTVCPCLPWQHHGWSWYWKEKSLQRWRTGVLEIQIAFRSVPRRRKCFRTWSRSLMWNEHEDQCRNPPHTSEKKN